MKLDRLHHGRKPIVALYDADVTCGVGYEKPGGLWYSVGYSWMEWCSWNNYGLGRYLYTVETNEANILRIESVEALITFDKEFRKGRSVEWLSVAEQYDGIEIAPYRSECRYNMNWYYGWDVASGVVWKASKLKVVPLQVVTGVTYGV